LKFFLKNMKKNYLIDFIRKLRSALSYTWSKKEYPNKLNTKIINEILLYEKKNIRTFIKKKETHNSFSKHIYFLFKKKKFLNFLQDLFVQKVFFIHNRFFLVIYLLRILFSKKANLWKKLLIENNIGNPVRFFLFPSTSGNKIFHTFHVKKFSDYAQTIKFDYIFEFGGGYGNMATNFLKINQKSNYIIFDTYEVSLLQYYYLKSLGKKVNFGDKGNEISLYHDISLLKKRISKIKTHKRKLFISNWALSEVPISIRLTLEKTILFFDYQLISFQKKFENINNYLYFDKLVKKNKKNNRLCELKEIEYYKDNYYLLTKPR